MSFLLGARSNDALRINPSNANRQLTTNGSNWLWAVFAVFLLSFLSWLIWSFLLKGVGQSHRNEKASHSGAAINSSEQRAPERVFHYLWTLAAFAGLVAYFTMASNLGNTPIRQYLNHGNNPNQTRQIFYARYIYWFVAWPMVVTATLILSGVGWATVIFAVIVQEFWVVSWLCGALVQSSYKWGFYAFGIMAYLILATILLHWGRRRSVRLSSKHYTPLAAVLVLVWLLYIIAWALSEGANRLSVTGEMIFYGILDLISVPLLGFVFLALSRSWDQHTLGLNYTQGRVRGYDSLDHDMAGRQPGVLETGHVHNGAEQNLHPTSAPHTVV